VQGRQYVLWAKGVRQLDAVNEWFHKAGFQPARSQSCTKAAATNSAAVFEKALQELTKHLKNLSEVTAMGAQPRAWFCSGWLDGHPHSQICPFLGFKK
jgi:hypothetical protein